jgi:hypothetical protein
MRKQPYYSIRTGKNPNATGVDLPTLIHLFRDVYDSLAEKGYYQEAFGYYCVDADWRPGTLGTNVEAQIFRKLRKANLWPIEAKCANYSEDDLFDMIEFLYDYVSKPIDGEFHNYANCGWHYKTFDQKSGQQEYRNEIDGILRDYSRGYELSAEGEILAFPENGLDELIQSPLPQYDPENVENRVNAAILKFRRARSSQEDKRDAIRDLADVLEFLRPKLGNTLTSKDENDLFIIANAFGIRHHNDQQKTDYDKSIWHDWMFYYYLATIHAVLRLINKNELSNS